MIQQGFVIEVVDEVTAKIKMTRHSACASCGKCATTSESKDIIVEVDNRIGAKVGDKVDINMETMNVMKAALIVYLVPLAFLLIGTIVTNYALSSIGITQNIEIWSAVSGIVSMAVVFLILKLNDHKFRESRQYIPIIVKVI